MCIRDSRQSAEIFGDTAVVITDCDYGLLLDGKPTTHHFAVTEVYVPNGDGWKPVSYTHLLQDIIAANHQA